MKSSTPDGFRTMENQMEQQALGFMVCVYIYIYICSVQFGRP